MHMYTMYMQNFTVLYVYMWPTGKRQIHIFNGPFIFVIGPEICYFCTAYKSQHFSTKFNTFLRNTYMFPWIFFRSFELLNMLSDIFKIPSSVELGLQKSAHKHTAVCSSHLLVQILSKITYLAKMIVL